LNLSRPYLDNLAEKISDHLKRQMENAFLQLDQANEGYKALQQKLAKGLAKLNTGTESLHVQIIAEQKLGGIKEMLHKISDEDESATSMIEAQDGKENEEPANEDKAATQNEDATLQKLEEQEEGEDQFGEESEETANEDKAATQNEDATVQKLEKNEEGEDENLKGQSKIEEKNETDEDLGSTAPKQEDKDRTRERSYEKQPYGASDDVKQMDEKDRVSEKEDGSQTDEMEEEANENEEQDGTKGTESTSITSNDLAEKEVDANFATTVQQSCDAERTRNTKFGTPLEDKVRQDLCKLLADLQAFETCITEGTTECRQQLSALGGPELEDSTSDGTTDSLSEAKQALREGLLPNPPSLLELSSGLTTDHRGDVSHTLRAEELIPDPPDSKPQDVLQMEKDAAADGEAAATRTTNVQSIEKAIRIVEEMIHSLVGHSLDFHGTEGLHTMIEAVTLNLKELSKSTQPEVQLFFSVADEDIRKISKEARGLASSQGV